MPWGAGADACARHRRRRVFPAAIEVAPIALSAVRAWIRRVPTITVDGSPTSGAALAARLANFWAPSATVVTSGKPQVPCKAASPPTTAHHLGSLPTRRRPLDQDALLPQRLSRVVSGHRRLRRGRARDARRLLPHLPAAERRALHDPLLVLPFANERTRSGQGARYPRIQAGVAPTIEGRMTSHVTAANFTLVEGSPQAAENPPHDARWRLAIASAMGGFRPGEHGGRVRLRARARTGTH